MPLPTNSTNSRFNESSYSSNKKQSSASIGMSKSASNVQEKNVNNNRNSDEVLIPKDSVTILDELKPGLVYITKSTSNNKIVASVEIDGKTFFGSGMSDSTAKQSAAEGALKHLMFDLIMSTMTNNIDGHSLYNNESWKLLGSFAMFKLIEEWLIYYTSEDYYKKFFETSTQSRDLVEKEDNDEGTTIIVEKIDNNSNKTKHEMKKGSRTIETANKKVLAADTNAIVCLNALLGSKIIFNDLNINFNKPPFAFSILVDNVEYVGETAGSKKQAKHNVAKKVLIKKFGYEEVKE